MNADRIPVKLKKEPLVDALFEIRFSSSISASSVLPGVLFSRIEIGHKQIEKLQAADIPSQIRNIDPNLRFQPLLKLRRKNFHILIGDSSLAVACEMPYVGWAIFKKEILEITKCIFDSGVIDSIDRYSIKYIDIIEGKGLSEQISRLNISLKLGGHTLKEEPFNVRIDIQKDDFTHITQVAAPVSVLSTKGVECSGVLIDIDTISDCKTDDLQSLLRSLPERLEKIHDSNKSMFFRYLTPDTIHYLEPVYE